MNLPFAVYFTLILFITYDLSLVFLTVAGWYLSIHVSRGTTSYSKPQQH